MTLTDDRAIAAAAIIGESSQPNAGYRTPARVPDVALRYLLGGLEVAIGIGYLVQGLR